MQRRDHNAGYGAVRVAGGVLRGLLPLDDALDRPFIAPGSPWNHRAERLKKFEEMRLAELRAVTGRGRTREIVLRYDAEKVVEVCG